jgi:hypothetical protein
MISISSDGSSGSTEKFLQAMQRLNVDGVLAAAASRGVAALSKATPRDSGLSASSWSYEISKNATSVVITWMNSDIENGFPVALMIQYGHGTGTGGYVPGKDFINPAMRPVFDEIADTVWKAVTSA